jgi:Lipase (class 3)
MDAATLQIGRRRQTHLLLCLFSLLFSCILYHQQHCSHPVVHGLPKFDSLSANLEKDASQLASKVSTELKEWLEDEADHVGDELVSTWRQGTNLLSSVAHRIGLDDLNLLVPKLTPNVFGSELQFVWDRMRRHGLYALAAYCDETQLALWTCNVCQLLTAINHASVADELRKQSKSTRASDSEQAAALMHNITVIDEPTNSLLAYLAVNHHDKEVVIAFRGTRPDSFSNVITDLDILPKSVSMLGANAPKTAFVHDGFWQAFSALKPRLNNSVADLAKGFPLYRIVFVGHSLGGALATLAAAHFSTPEMLDRVYLSTFGSPRVGNRAFAKWLDSRIPPNPAMDAHSTRYVNGADPVCHLPPAELEGFYHVGREVWVDEKRHAVRVCRPFTEDSTCSAKQFGLSIPDHIQLLGITLHLHGCAQIT